MALSKNDFQQIAQVVKTEIKPLDKRLGSVEIRLGSIDKRLGSVEKNVKKIKKDLKTTIEFFDDHYLNLKKRTNRIEDHLGLPTLSI